MAWGWIKTHESIEVQEFLKSHEGKNSDGVLLKIPRTSPWSRDYIFSQINGKRTFEKKFPSFMEYRGMIIPPKRAIEQASSEASAKYKAKLFSGKKLVDLSMGMGSDLFFMGGSFESALGIELSLELEEITKYNFSKIGVKKYGTHKGEGLKYLDHINGEIDLVYVDPDRRNASGRVFRFGDSEPNLLGRLPYLLGKAKKILVKSSPMLDLDYGIRELGKPDSIRIISIGQECKELLFEFNRDSSEKTMLHLDWYSNGNWKFHSFPIEQINSGSSIYGGLEGYIFDPNPSFIKARAFGLLSEKFGLRKISRNTHLFTRNDENIEFPGRGFRVLDCGDSKALRKFRGMKFEILLRNFSLEKEVVLKKFKIREGKGDFLFLYSDGEGKKKWARCEPI